MPGRASLQKSQEGLLRSILYQILRQRPELLPLAAPKLWQSYIHGNTVSHGVENPFRNVPELLTALQRISAVMTASKIKFCFFIDGLDEYEGKPDDIIRLIKIFEGLPEVKVCVSSRPWNEFERGFGQDGSTKLYIQELTRSDIDLYVRDTLEWDPRYAELTESHDEGLNRFADITDTSKGVFLWVYLVIQLLDGLTNADRIVDLRRRLSEIPTELNELFRRTLWTVDRLYRESTAQMFLITLQATETLPLIAYWYMDQVDSDLALQIDIKPLSCQTTNRRLRQMRKRLNACCKGLLEVQFYESDNPEDEALASSILFSWKVDFLHHTMYDFLQETDIQELLNKWAATDFSARTRICEAMLAQIKTAPQEQPYFRDNGPIWRLRRVFSHHFEKAAVAQNRSSGQEEDDGHMMLLVKELNRTMHVQESIINFTSSDLAWNLTLESEEAAADTPSQLNVWSKLSRGASRFLKMML